MDEPPKDYRCKQCGQGKLLHVHDKVNGVYKPDGFWAYCQFCDHGCLVCIHYSTRRFDPSDIPKE